MTDSVDPEDLGKHAFDLDIEALLSERSRLARELRCMQSLVSRMRARHVKNAPFLPSTGQSDCIPEVEVPSEMGLDAVHAENVRMARNLRGLQVLVMHLKSRQATKALDDDDDLVGIPVAYGDVVRMPGDGSCLFHSLAHGLEATSASALRDEIADFIVGQPEVVIADRPLKDWIFWETGESSVQEYAASMSVLGEWGGAIEMALCSLLKQVCVRVYMSAGRGFQCICEFNECRPKPTNTLCVVYRPGHYDAFIERIQLGSEQNEASRLQP